MCFMTELETNALIEAIITLRDEASDATASKAAAVYQKLNVDGSIIHA